MDDVEHAAQQRAERLRKRAADERVRLLAATRNPDPYIARLVAEAPPLTDAQRDRLAVIFGSR